MCRHFLWFPAVAVLSLVLDVNSGAGFAAGQDGHPAFLLIKSITNPLPVHQLAFTKSSTSLVCFCNGEGFEQFGTAYVWDVHSAEQKARVKPYPPYYFVTVPYARLCFWEDNGIAILDEFIEREKRSVQLRDFGPAVNMGQVCFSGDGEYLAGVEMGTANLTLWELASGKRVARMNFPRDYVKGLRAIAIDPQHGYVAVGVRASGN